MKRNAFYYNEDTSFHQNKTNRDVILIFQVYETRKSWFNKLNYNVQANTPGVDPKHIYIHCEIAIGDRIYGSTKDKHIFSQEGKQWNAELKAADALEEAKFEEENGRKPSNIIDETPIGNRPIGGKRKYDVTNTAFFSIPERYVSVEKFNKIKLLAEEMVGKKYGFISAYASAIQSIPICKTCCIPSFLTSSSFSEGPIESASCSQLVAWLLHHSGIFKFQIIDADGCYLGSDFSFITTSKLFAILNENDYLVCTTSPAFSKTSN